MRAAMGPPRPRYAVYSAALDRWLMWHGNLGWTWTTDREQRTTWQTMPQAARAMSRAAKAAHRAETVPVV